MELYSPTSEKVVGEEQAELVSMAELLVMLLQMEAGAHIILEIHRFMVLEAMLVTIQVVEPRMSVRVELVEQRPLH
jgi:hypothetical protein